MTEKETLFRYRMKQADETLSDAEKMMRSQVSPRSVINRTYYSMFYAILALFIKDGVSLKTSKHAGVISIFDKEYVHAGKIQKDYSKLLHKMLESRQEVDYKELVEISVEDAERCIEEAKSFLNAIKAYIEKAAN